MGARKKTKGGVSRRPKPPCSPRGTCTAGTVSAANGLMQGCRGRSPRRNKLIVSPFPTGEGGWGIGGRKVNQKQGRQARRKASPLRVPEWQGRQATAPPAPPAGHLLGRDYKCRKQLSAGDARGEAPCIRKPKTPPFPAGRGRGDILPLRGRGAKSKAKGEGVRSADHKKLSPAGASDARQAQPGEQATQATQAEHCRQAPSGTRHRTP